MGLTDWVCTVKPFCTHFPTSIADVRSPSLIRIMAASSVSSLLGSELSDGAQPSTGSMTNCRSVTPSVSHAVVDASASCHPERLDAIMGQLRRATHIGAAIAGIPTEHVTSQGRFALHGLLPGRTDLESDVDWAAIYNPGHGELRTSTGSGWRDRVRIQSNNRYRAPMPSVSVRVLVDERVEARRQTEWLRVRGVICKAAMCAAAIDIPGDLAAPISSGQIDANIFAGAWPGL